MPSQPRDLRVNEIGETSIGLQWAKPTQVGEQILSYELYWNDTYAKVNLMIYIFWEKGNCGTHGDQFMKNNFLISFIYI